MHILNTIVPVFLIIAIGMVLRWRGFFNADFAGGLSRLTYWVGLPILLFYKTASATYNLQDAGNVYLVVLAGMLACILASLFAGKLMRLSARDTAIMAHGAFRGNLVYVGLPIILYSLANHGSDSGSGESLVIIVIALTVPVYNIVAVVILLAGKHRFDTGAIFKMLQGILTNPLIIASVAGLLYNGSFPALHPLATRTLESIAQMALPLALFSIGATLYQEQVRGRILPATVGALIKVGVAPLAGLGVALWMGLGAAESQIALLLLACPSAISSHIMAEQMVGRQNLSASIVIVSTLLSVASFSMILAL